MSGSGVRKIKGLEKMDQLIYYASSMPGMWLLTSSFLGLCKDTVQPEEREWCFDKQLIGKQFAELQGKLQAESWEK